MNRWRFLGLCGLVLCLFLAGYALRAQDAKRVDPVKVFNTSVALESAGKLAEATAEMEKLLAEQAQDYLVNLRLGWLAYLLQNYDRSETFYREALEISRDRSIEAMLGLTLPLAAEAEWGAVEELYKRILAADPAHYTANLRLGQILLARGKYAQAEKYLQTALTHYPAEYEANLSSAWNAYYLGRSEPARQLFQRTLMLSPGDTSATTGLGLVK